MTQVSQACLRPLSPTLNLCISQLLVAPYLSSCPLLHLLQVAPYCPASVALRDEVLEHKTRWVSRPEALLMFRVVIPWCEEGAVSAAIKKLPSCNTHSHKRGRKGLPRLTHKLSEVKALLAGRRWV